MNKKQHIIRIGQILDACKGCELNEQFGQNQSEAKCVNCPYYKELKQLSSEIDHTRKVESTGLGKEIKASPQSVRPPFTYDEYLALKVLGETDTHIAKIYQTTVYTIKLWKKKELSKMDLRYIETRMLPFTYGQYKKLKQKKLTDEKIAEMHYITALKLRNWKKHAKEGLQILSAQKVRQLKSVQ